MFIPISAILIVVFTLLTVAANIAWALVSFGHFIGFMQSATSDVSSREAARIQKNLLWNVTQFIFHILTILVIWLWINQTSAVDIVAQVAG